MTDTELDFRVALAEKLRSISDRMPSELSSRVTINLSKEELDTCAWCVEESTEGIGREE